MRLTVGAAVRLAVGVCALTGACCAADLNVAYQWDKIDLSPRPDAGDDRSRYAPENNMPYRLKIWNGSLFVAVPRFRHGVPATLCRSRDGAAMRPFPSRGLQTVGNCMAAQNVKDMDVDHLGQLWLLDVGRVHDADPAGPADRTCEPKLLVVRADTGALIRSAVMPAAVQSADSVLTGIAIDLKTLTAVVADVGATDPGFIVYSLPEGVYRKYRCATLSAAAAGGDGGGTGRANGRHDEAQLTVSPIDGILYFTAVRLDRLYAVPLSVLGAPPARDVGHHVHDHGPKADASTAMIMDTGGNLYLGMTHKVIAWNTIRHGFDVKELYIQEVRLEWISSFAFDEHGYLWIVSAAFDDFLAGSNISKPVNVKVFKRYCGTTSFALQDSSARLSAAATANATARSSAARRTVDGIASVRVVTVSALLLSVLFTHDAML